MEGELKIQQLAQLYHLSVQVTYLPYISPTDTSKDVTDSSQAASATATLSPAAELMTRRKKRAMKIQLQNRAKLRVAKEPSTTIVSEDICELKKKKTLDLSSGQSSILLKAIGQKKRSIEESSPETLRNSISIPQEIEKKDHKRAKIESNLLGDSSVAPTCPPPSVKSTKKSDLSVPDASPSVEKPTKKLFASAFKFLKSGGGK